MSESLPSSPGALRTVEAPFVGREPELGQLRVTLDRALAGQGSMALLSGEPGIGKTRLAETFAVLAQDRGATVVWGRCTEWDGAPPYWPWLQVLRTLLRDADDNQLRSWLGVHAASLAQIVPEIRQRFPDLPALAAIDPDQARFQFFESVSNLITRVAGDTPIVIVLDDLHWSDAPSLLLLQFLVPQLREARVLILGTYRNVEVGRRHPLLPILADLARGQAAQRIMLHGLSHHHVTEVIALLAGTGTEMSEALANIVYEETEGNPFFVTEVTRLLLAEGAFHREVIRAGASRRIPESVREVVGQRLERLSDACNQTLLVAAVIGRDFNLPLLERVRDLPTDAVLDTLDEAIRAQLVQADAAIGKYRFSHAIVRETLYDELSTAQRVRLHNRIGTALAELHANHLDLVLPDLAHHAFQAAPGGDLDRAITYAIAAGHQANARLAWEDAVGQFERAMQLLDLGDQPDEQQRIEVLLALLDAQIRSGAAKAAVLTRERAITIIRAHGTIEQLARAATAYDLETSNYVDLDIAAVLDEVHAALPMDDSLLRVQVLYRLAGSLNGLSGRLGSVERRVELADAARAMAERLNDPVALGYALSCRLDAFLEPEWINERIKAARAVDDLARATQSRRLETIAASAHICIAMDLGDISVARTAGRRRFQLLNDLRIPAERWMVAGLDAGFAALDGNFEAAEQRAHEARTLGEQVNLNLWQPAYEYWSLLFLIRFSQGRLAEVESAVSDYLEEHPNDTYWLSRAALLAAAGGRLDEGRDRFERLAANDFATITTGPWWYVNLIPLIEVCLLLEDRERAHTLHRLLAPFAGRNVNEITFCYGAADYYLGRLAMLLDRHDAARRSFEAALEMNERMGARPFVAQTQAAYAALLAMSADQTKLDTAQTLATSALAIASELGMRPLAEQARSLLSALPVDLDRRSITLPYGLSPREFEVLRLLVDGQTDREIAMTLFISHRTVMRHVTGILNKLGVSSRTAAATRAVRDGMV